MKIVFIRSNPISPDSRVEKEVNSLIQNGHHVQIIAWDREYSYKERKTTLVLKNTACKITHFGIHASFGGGFKKNIKALLLFQLAIRKWLIKNQFEYDVIHACDFDTAFVAGKVARKLQKEMVYDIFDYYVDSFTVPQKLRKIIEKADIKTINQSSHTIICTEQRKNQIALSKPKKLTIIHNTPYDLPLGVNSFMVDKEKLSIAYIGIFQEGRMIKELVDVVSENNELELHIGGFGQLGNYINDMSQRYINIHFYGKLPYDKTLQLEKSCDIITALYDPSVPNHVYAAPNKFYEALMLGKPLIMARNTGLDSIVSAEQFGKVIDFNKDDLQTALKQLANEKQSFSEISKKMKQYYKTKFSWEEMERRLLSIYKSMEEDNEKNYGSLWNETRSNKNVPVSKRSSI
ncbi:glycosyltransferase [Alkalibacterium sp. 20]|uniref:glycosyltransferase n=1 Tax=Alkalibacterium sp. 20 TaxID=1798803 RepID=UPI00090029C0|nr:glycosyltransferase [Alkalibacterium sp. 20]OJF94206.1 hypothetical protein AX762_07815 [Alkalibacterium sp. 20]